MSEIKIYKGDKYYSLRYIQDTGRDKKKFLYLSNNGGEGMEVTSGTEEFLYDAIDDFFREYF